ncbi:unnamed protein product [Ilex paraguariensis]|uniref:Disease resistance protein n=1 Tax=Ilex paraguariensis TaxID=185542 RepID=A0ABC8RNL0_9AQUA
MSEKKKDAMAQVEKWKAALIEAANLAGMVLGDKEISAQPNGLMHLQKQLLSEILKSKCVEIWNVDEGITKIKDNIGYKRVLIVLDDVD